MKIKIAHGEDRGRFFSLSIKYFKKFEFGILTKEEILKSIPYSQKRADGNFVRDCTGTFSVILERSVA